MRVGEIITKTKEIEKKINEGNLEDLKYKPLDKKTVLNLKYDTIYIIKNKGIYGGLENLEMINYYIFIRTPKYFINPDHFFYNQDGYSLIRIIMTKSQNTARGGMTTWSQSEVEIMETTDNLFQKYAGESLMLEIAEIPSRVRFLNWDNISPWEVKE